MKIHLISHTPEPLKSVAIPFMNMGVGRDIRSFDDITKEEASDSLKEIFKSHLDAPLEFCSWNLFWEDIPLFLRAQLVRHRVGWGFAERSLRFYDANLRDPIKDYDWDAMPSIKDKKFQNKYDPSDSRSMQDVVQDEMDRQMFIYSEMIKQGIDQQEARNIIGVWYPTAVQTTCSYRALRTMLADRLSSQAHPFWRKAANQIKDLVAEVSPELGAGLIDGCEMDGKCRWRSRFDRDCDSCIERGLQKSHEHKWTRDTSFGKETQCDCGTINKKLLASNAGLQQQ